MVVRLEGRIAGGDELLDTDLRDLAIVSGADGTFLYAATGQNGGLSVYRISADGALAGLSDSAYFSFSGISMGSFAMVSLDGATQLILNGAGTGALVSYGIDPDGGLSIPAQNDLPGSGSETPGALTGTALKGGITALYMADADGTLTALVSDGAGGIADNAALKGKAGSYDLSGTVVLQVAEVGSGPGASSFLLAADAGAQGVRAYAINQNTGDLRITATLGAGDGLGVAAPTALEVVQAHGATWVVLAAAGSSSLSVMQLGSDGSLTPADHLIDTLATRFGGVSALKVVKVGGAEGHVFVLAGGADDGLSLFSLLPGGRLVHLQSLAHTFGAGLENVTAIEAVVTGTEIQVFVSSGSAAGLSQFSIPLDDLGSVIGAGGGTGSGSVLRGTGGADLIMGAPGQDRLLGRGGDDILVAGANGGVLTGGEGADIFVLRPATGALRITDFRAGTDQIDMSHFPMLRSIGQLSLTETSSGLEITYGSTSITVLSDDGKPLSAAQIWPGGFATPDRVPIPGGVVIRVTQGAEGSDVLNGDAGRDMIYGLGGNDMIRTGAGKDRIEGGTGRDTIFGGAGKDRIEGGAGNDKGFGGDGSDRLYGGAGDDRLNGGSGNDRLYGGSGDDRLAGDTGNDRVFGGSGNDETLGGKGNDRLHGGAGRDTGFGGAGRDTLKGGKGGDTLAGGAGKDTLKGGAGRDTLIGGAGADTLIGGKARDTLKGGAGADTFVFGKNHGADRIMDFTGGTDLIRIAVGGVGFDDLTFKKQGSDTVIGTGEGTITVTGLKPGDFSADDFLFG